MRRARTWLMWACLQGTFSTGGSTTCTGCSSGYYSTSSGSTSCTQCPAGYSCSDVSAAPVACPAGTRSAAGATACTGTYRQTMMCHTCMSLSVQQQTCACCPARVCVYACSMRHWLVCQHNWPVFLYFLPGWLCLPHCCACTHSMCCGLHCGYSGSNYLHCVCGRPDEQCCKLCVRWLPRGEILR